MLQVVVFFNLWPFANCCQVFFQHGSSTRDVAGYFGEEQVVSLVRLISGVALMLLISIRLGEARAAEWVLVAGDPPGLQVFIDRSSIRVLDTRFRVAVDLINYRDDGFRWRSQISANLVDCQNRQTLTQFITVYAESWGRGEQMDAAPMNSEWRTAKRGSNMAALLNYTCDF